MVIMCASPDEQCGVSRCSVIFRLMSYLTVKTDVDFASIYTQLSPPGKESISRRIINENEASDLNKTVTLKISRVIRKRSALAPFSHVTPALRLGDKYRPAAVADRTFNTPEEDPIVLGRVRVGNITSWFKSRKCRP